MEKAAKKLLTMNEVASQYKELTDELAQSIRKKDFVNANTIAFALNLIRFEAVILKDCKDEGEGYGEREEEKSDDE